jgi:hypothetical protein
MLWWSVGAFINRLGKFYDIFSLYFISRILIKNVEDIASVLKVLVLICIPITVLMIYEYKTGRNMFSILGGVPEYSMIRGGKIRAQGSFEHPILAGSFGATLFPVLFGVRSAKGITKKLFILGIISSILIVMASNSSGPLISLIFGGIGMVGWKYRDKMNIIAFFTTCGLIGLHIVMKAPVWALIMRMGSSGSYYHRYQIIDETINNFNEWWLLGTRSTTHWGHLHTMHDIANNYCRIAIDGGVFSVLLFISIIIMALKNAIKAANKASSGEHFQKLYWCIGVSLFVHAVSLMGVSYVGSSLLMLFFTISILSNVYDY